MGIGNGVGDKVHLVEARAHIDGRGDDREGEHARQAKLTRRKEATAKEGNACGHHAKQRGG